MFLPPPKLARVVLALIFLAPLNGHVSMKPLLLLLFLIRRVLSILIRAAKQLLQLSFPLRRILPFLPRHLAGYLRLLSLCVRTSPFALTRVGVLCYV